MKTNQATRQQREEALAEGEAAARRGAPYSDNPYLANSEIGRRCAWSAGYWDERNRRTPLGK